jgi:MFS superfamily sulfate permease-like transporter
MPAYGRPCAIALAARGQRLGLATLLVSIPTLYGVFAGIGVMIFGF